MKVWQYGYTTITHQGSGSAFSGNADISPAWAAIPLESGAQYRMGGLGFGLPMSRLYAEYFGEMLRVLQVQGRFMPKACGCSMAQASCITNVQHCTLPYIPESGKAALSSMQAVPFVSATRLMLRWPSSAGVNARLWHRCVPEFEASRGRLAGGSC